MRNSILPATFLRGINLGLDVERILIPDWSKEALGVNMEVDHIVELQVVPDNQQEIWDNFGNYELLDETSNGRAGPQLQQNIAAERRELARQTGSQSWLSRDLVFDQVVPQDGPSGQRWVEDEIRGGDHLDIIDDLNGPRPFDAGASPGGASKTDEDGGAP
jgi:hypothetical protein